MGENVFSNLHFYTSIKFYIIDLVNLLDTIKIRDSWIDHVEGLNSLTLLSSEIPMFLPHGKLRHKQDIKTENSCLRTNIVESFSLLLIFFAFYKIDLFCGLRQQNEASFSCLPYLIT